ncbi:arylsulfatase [Tundrisphaera sp. TA3]|uniref:arylsulfatase n=1 Tax=Tundrisphaera sp. TA3 TaxID=3435775 RepID=UPI003EB8F622
MTSLIRVIAGLSAVVWPLMAAPARGEEAPQAPPPNVLLIVTDDQGYGDLGFHGNPDIRTPRLDALARESVRFASFYVSPVCSPTRASLMTGRYSYRTGVVDTFRGRSIMHTGETTIAEMLSRAGYRTGIFGKWHLGDNAPSRPMDQGFDESLVIRGGGVGQASDLPGSGPGNFDPVLEHNGKPEPTPGFTTDLFTDATLRFIGADRSRPFFATLTYTAPHVPLDVPATDKALLKSDDATSKLYAMLARVDSNVGRVLDRLDELGIARNTLVIFLSDNGPQQPRFNAGLRGLKVSVHEGGIRVPCFVRWPGTLEAGRVVGPIAAHIDLVPTILSACRVERPASVAFDGRDLMPLLRGEPVPWPERTLFFQWHRGDRPERYRAFAARGDRYKLAQPVGVSGAANVDPSPLPSPLPYELYDIRDDPAEAHNLAATHPQEVAALLKAYEAWFADVTADPAHALPRIDLGSPRENPSTLTRQDWRGEGVVQDASQMGGWDVDVIRAGTFDLAFRFEPGPEGDLEIEVGGQTRRAKVADRAATSRVEGIPIPAGPTRLRAWVRRGPTSIGVSQADVRRRDDGGPPGN